MNSPSTVKYALLAALLILAPAAASGNSADSTNIRVDTRGRNLVSLTVTPAPDPALAPLPGEPQPAPTPTGSNTVASGGVKQFLAMALYDDGSSEDVTAQAIWSVGSSSPKGSSLFGGLFKAGNPVTESVVRMLASFGAGSSSRMGSSDVVVLPGMTVRIEYTLQSVILNSQWSLSAQAIVAGNNSPITSSDIRWDMDADGVFDDKTGTYITQSYSHKRSQLVAVQVVTSGGETATAAVFFTLGATPEGVPKVSDVADAFSNSLYKLQNGSMASLPSLPSSTSKLAVVIHGLENNAKMGWVESLCGAIENSPAGATVVAYDWALMADPSIFSKGQTALVDQSVPSEFSDLLNDLLTIRENGRVNGMLLAEKLNRERLMGNITYGTAIHLIGHSAGGFVAGECAARLSKAGFSNLQATMLDTPLPYKSHVGNGWKTERYISSLAGGRFETEPRTGTNSARYYNIGANLKGDKIETISWQTSAALSYLTNSQSTAAVLLTNYEAVPASGITEGSNYRRVEIQHPDLPSGLVSRHSYAYGWYTASVNSTMPGGEGGFGYYSNLLGPTPFPSAPSAIPAPMMAETQQPQAIPRRPLTWTISPISARLPARGAGIH